MQEIRCHFFEKKNTLFENQSESYSIDINRWKIS